MMIPSTGDFDHHNPGQKRLYFIFISTNGNKLAYKGDGVPDAASVQIGYKKQRQLTFWEFFNIQESCHVKSAVGSVMLS